RCLFLCSAPPPSEVYTLSLHDALPIYVQNLVASSKSPNISSHVSAHPEPIPSLRVSINCVKVLTLVAASIMDSSSPNFFMVSRKDRKSTRLNSSHVKISYAVFCFKKTQ